MQYARAKWGNPADPKTAEGIAPKLGRDLQLRLDVLGVDGEHLLNIEPQDALRVLEELERDAELENFQSTVRSDPLEGGAIVRMDRPGDQPSRSHMNEPARRNTQGANRPRRQRRTDR